MYSPWSTVSQLWHLKHQTCHWRSSATNAWPSLNWFPQPAQAPGSALPSPVPLVPALLPIGVEASRIGIPTHRWHSAWPTNNAQLVEINEIRSAGLETSSLTFAPIISSKAIFILDRFHLTLLLGRSYSKTVQLNSLMLDADIGHFI